MDYNKLRYDLALQTATIRFMKNGKLDASITDSEELLGIFAVCYKEARSISDQTIRDYLRD